MVAPVVLIAFNRPEQTKRTLECIRQAAPEDLFLIVDAPRDNRPDDAEGCAAVRTVLENIDWPCRVHRRYADATGHAPMMPEALDACLLSHVGSSEPTASFDCPSALSPKPPGTRCSFARY